MEKFIILYYTCIGAAANLDHRVCRERQEGRAVANVVDKERVGLEIKTEFCDPGEEGTDHA